ncbi:MAG TPA: M56 family metallopeptidase [Thermoanaerobaculia bacterium]|jgi:beta-lactamase regulating signal transducer with metallopeptidase domain
MTLLLFKVTLILALAFAAAAALRRASAASRHAVLVAGQVGVLVMPLLAVTLPRMTIRTNVPDTLPPFRALAAPLRGAAARPARTLPVRRAAEVLWLAGAAAMLASDALASLRARRIARRGTRIADDVVLSDEIGAPATIGATVVLPRNAQTWSASRLEAVLAHERAHIARRDGFWRAAGDLATALWWFHPLAWLVRSRAMLEREASCDDAVLTRDADPLAYAELLVDIARERRTTPFALAAAQPAQLERRLRRILDGRAARRRTRAALPLIAAVAALAIPLVAAASLAARVLVSPPRAGEPDLRGDAFVWPESERVPMSAAVPDTPATGPDAALIARFREFAAQPSQAREDLVPDRSRWALTRVRDGQLVEPLIESLRDADWRVRAYAGWCLAVAADARAVEPLVAELTDPVWRVRSGAAFALAEIGRGADEPMRRALSDDAWQVRSSAVRYFGKQPGARPIIEAMRADRHIAVRNAADEALQP